MDVRQTPRRAMLTTALLSLALAAQPSFPYLPGERMGFGINYLGMRMGVASISVGTIDQGYVPVELQAKTTGIVGVYTLRQNLVSWVEPSTGMPGGSQIQGVEGSYRHTDTTRFDRAAGTAVVREIGKHDNTYRFTVPADALDFVALVFRLRAMPLKIGDRHAFQVLSGRDVNQVVVAVEGRDELDTAIGKLPALRVRIPTAFSGKFSEKNPTIVWFSDDERRIVLRITTDFAIGHATADVTEYQPGVVAAPAAESTAPGAPARAAPTAGPAGG